MGIDFSTYKQREPNKKFESKKHLFNKEIRFSFKFSDKKKALFYKELALLISSNIDFKQALDILTEQFKKAKDKALIISIKNDVISGKTLHETLAANKYFSPYEYYSIKIGEETRKLDHVLVALQKYFDKKIKMKRQLISVFTYPSFVLLVTFGVLYFMMNNVVPMFTSVFKQFGAELPSLTKKIVILSENFSTITIILILTIITICSIHYSFKANDRYRYLTTTLVLKTPFFGGLIRTIYLSRFCQSLNLLLSAKTPLITSLELTQKMIGFYPITSSLNTIRNDILKGCSLGASLAKHSIFDHKLVSMVKVAEQINKLDDMFERLTEQYNDEVEHQTKMIGVVLEPLIIIIIGGIVGVIMIAMYSPMFNLSKIIS